MTPYDWSMGAGGGGGGGKYFFLNWGEITSAR